MREKQKTNLTKEDYIELKKLYKKNKEEKKVQFTFQGQPILTAYAFYLLEFLRPKYE